MVWTPAAHGYEFNGYELWKPICTDVLPIMDKEKKTGRPKTAWEDVIQRDLDSLLSGWCLEEAEVASKDRKM